MAWVLGDTLEAARLGALSVKVRYEPLPAILSIEEAIAQQSILSMPARMHRGDASAAISESPLRLRGGTAHRRSGAFLSRNAVRPRLHG